MNEILFEKAQKAEHPLSRWIVEDKKTLILERITKAVEKLKEARREIRECAQLTLEMKDAGDGAADEVLAAVAEAFASCSISWILKD